MTEENDAQPDVAETKPARKKRNFGKVMVMIVVEDDAGNEVYEPAEVEPSDYKNTAAAEKWIRDNAEDDYIYAVMRLVKKVTASTVTEKRVQLQTIEE